MNKYTAVASGKEIAAMIRMLESGVECNIQRLTIPFHSVDFHPGFSKLIRSLINKPMLKSLCISSQKGISFENITCIANLLDQNVNPRGRLCVLNLSRSEVTDEHVAEICKGLNNNIFLVRLELYFNNIGDTGAKCLGNVLTTNHSLVSLDLRRNKIKVEGAEAIAEGIMQRQYPSQSTIATHFSTKPFKEFQLFLCSDDNISVLGAKTFASLLHKQHSALSPLVTLTVLQFSECDIGDEGAVAIAKSLKSYNTDFGLKKLDLSDNRVGNAGAIAFANALKQNTALCTLNLCFNQIGYDGGIALCQTLEAYNNTLQLLHLGKNPCSDFIWKNDASIYSYLRDLERNHLERNHDKTIATEYKQRVKAINIFKFIASKGPYEMGQ